MAIPKLPLSTSRSAGELIYLSGQLGFSDQGELVGPGIEEQTRQVMNNIANVLQAQGCTLGDIVKVTVWITDKRDFAGFNKTYGSFFEDGEFPARSTVVSELVVDGARIEIEAIAKARQ